MRPCYQSTGYPNRHWGLGLSVALAPWRLVLGLDICSLSNEGVTSKIYDKAIVGGFAFWFGPKMGQILVFGVRAALVAAGRWEEIWGLPVLHGW